MGKKNKDNFIEISDHLLEYRYIFPHFPDKNAVEQFDSYHKISENLYVGEGIWMETAHDPFHPTVRQTSRRVIGYLGAYKSVENEAYLLRAKEGLEYLLREQDESGEYIWYRNSIIGVLNRNDGLYETGLAGVALLEGYRVLGDVRYIEASKKAAQWEISCPISENYNYNMFAVWHLARLYKFIPDKLYIDSAVDKSLSTIRDQKDDGRWKGHNSWIWYHNIIIRGLAELYSILPEKHRIREDLDKCLIRAINRLVLDQTCDGSIPPAPDLSELSLRNSCNNYHRNAFALQAMCYVAEYTDISVKNLIDGIMWYRYNTEKIQDVQNDCSGIIPGSFKDRFKRAKFQLLMSDASMAIPGEKTIWTQKFKKFHSAGEWGELPDSSFICHFPGWKPVPGHLYVGYVGKGKGLCITVRNRILCGIGTDLSHIGLVSGNRYRLCCRMRVVYSECDPDQLLSVILSSYSGTDREKWDAITGCEYAVCKPITDDEFDFILWFTVKGDANYVYVTIDAEEIHNQGEISINIISMKLTDEGKPSFKKIDKARYEDYDCSVMALGEHLRRAKRRPNLYDE